MAITTLDGVIAGMQYPRAFSKAVSATLVAGRLHTYWGLGGNPGAGSYDTTLNGVTLSAPVNGQVPFTNPASGNAYLARLAATATQAGVLILADRLWHNGGYTITSTSAQNSTTPTWPARDANGSTNGEGVFLALEISGAAGAAAPTITATYTNSAGTGSRTATNIMATANSPAVGATYLMGLQSGDLGVRSLQSIQLSVSWASGTMNMVAYRPLAYLEIPGALIPNAIDALTSGMPRLYNDTVPYFMFVPNTTTATIINGTVNYTHG